MEARYRGQSFELAVPAEGWIESFHAAHQRRYGYAHPGSPVEAVTIRATVRAPGASISVDLVPESDGEAPHTVGLVQWKGRDLQVKRFWRDALGGGTTVSGPAIILEYSSTTWVPPHWTVAVDRWGSLLMSRDR